MKTIAWGTVLVLAAGCGAAAEEDLLSAVPRAEDLAIRAGDGAAQGGSEPLAALYVVTRQTSDRLNGMVGAALGTVWGIAANPPTQVDEGRVVWGPFTPTLSPATYRLVVERGEPGTVRYHVDARPKTSGDEAAFRTILVGTASPGGGRFAVDFTLARALDPAGGIDEDGGMVAEYALLADRVSVQIALQGGAVAAGYGYEQRRDGSGDMGFAARAGDLGELAIRSRWTPTGAGRADARDSAGGAVTECWDAAFRRVFIVSPTGAAGDPAACVGIDG